MADIKTTEGIQRAIRGNMTAAMRTIVEDLAGQASQKAPIKEGTLRASAHPSVETHGREVVGKVTFALPYARAQHEGLHFHHPRGGQAKYLEGPLTAMRPRYEKVLAEVMRRAINGHS